MAEKATPRPWKIFEIDPDAGSPGNPCITIGIDANGDGEWYSTVVSEMRERHLANARLIVQAVNAYDALVDALERTRLYIDHRYDDIHAQIDAALALAKQEAQ